MSVFDGEIEFKSVYMEDFVKKDKPLEEEFRKLEERLAPALREVQPFRPCVRKHAHSCSVPQRRLVAFGDQPQPLLYAFVRALSHGGRGLPSLRASAAQKKHSRGRTDQDHVDSGVLRFGFGKSPRRKAIDDDCLIVGLSRDSLNAKELPRKSPDVLCPVDFEYYKNAVERFKEDYPKLTKMYMTKEIDPVPIDHEIQDLKRTEYLVKYCSRELPFMSVNLARRARALQTLRLPDDVYIPDTSQKGSYRHPTPEKYKDPPSSLSMKPKFDASLQKELRRILRVRTGDTSYGVSHELLAQVVLDRSPFGPPREEPKFGRWRNPYIYTYRI